VRRIQQALYVLIASHKDRPLLTAFLRQSFTLSAIALCFSALHPHPFIPHAFPWQSPEKEVDLKVEFSPIEIEEVCKRPVMAILTVPGLAFQEDGNTFVG
jgi:hypothetical protein